MGLFVGLAERFRLLRLLLVGSADRVVIGGLEGTAAASVLVSCDENSWRLFGLLFDSDSNCCKQPMEHKNHNKFIFKYCGIVREPKLG